MKNHKLSIVVCTLLCVMVMVSGTILWGGCAAPEAPAPSPSPAPAPAPAPETIELSFMMMGSLESRSVKELLNPLINWLDKESGGRLKIVVYPGGQLAPPPEFFDATKEGVADMCDLGVGLVAARFPLHCVALLPLLFEEPASRRAGATLKALYEKYPELYKEFEGVKVLGFTATGAGHVHTTNKPIKKLEDWKGQVMVMVSKESADVTKALGGTPEMLAPPEIADALVKGVVDGNVVEYEGLFTFHHNEPMKYTTEVGLFLNTDAWIVNLDKWNSLSPDLQQLLERGVSRYCELHGYCFDIANTESRDKLEKQYADAGLPPIYVLPEDERARWIEAVMPIREDWVARADAKGVPGKAILEDVIKFAEQYSPENWPVNEKEYEDKLREWGSPGH